MNSYLITKAIKQAMKEYPGLESLDDPYPRIAEFLPSGGYEKLFPAKPNESSFQWSERVENEVSAIWSNI